MKKVITIDCDGVLADTVGAFVDWYTVFTGRELCYEDMDHHYVHDCTKTRWLHDVYDPLPFMQGLYDGSIQTLPLIGAVDAVKTLKDAGYTLIIVTGRGHAEMQITQQFVEKYFSGCFDQIVYGHEGTDQYVSKGQLCHEIGSLVHLDDVIFNTTNIAEYGIPSLLFDAPWNQGALTSDLVHRVDGWDQAVEWIQQNLGSER